jgi:hypothetical protein
MVGEALGCSIGRPRMRVLGPTFRPDPTEGSRSASAHTFIAHRNLGERFFNKIKQCRRVAPHYDKLAANYLAFIQPPCRYVYGCALTGPRPLSDNTAGVCSRKANWKIGPFFDSIGASPNAILRVKQQKCEGRRDEKKSIYQKDVPHTELILLNSSVIGSNYEARSLPVRPSRNDCPGVRAESATW